MKVIIISLLILGLSFSVRSQYNTQLIDSTKYWSIAHQPCPGCGGILYSYYIKFQGDTVINSSIYTKILQSYDEYMEDWELYGFIKEEEGKYYLRNLAGEDGLAYDFTVDIGDTITMKNPFGFTSIYAEIINIDSVFIEPANEYRKRITLFEYENFWLEEQWIEGIGSLAGITESGSDLSLLTGGDDYSLLCYYENSDLSYKTDLYPLCFYPIMGVHSNNFASVAATLIPNPVIDNSTLKLDGYDQKNLTIKILDIRGKIIEVLHITMPAEVEISSGKLNKGLYFYQVFEESKILISEKFIVL